MLPILTLITPAGLLFQVISVAFVVNSAILSGERSVNFSIASCIIWISATFSGYIFGPLVLTMIVEGGFLEQQRYVAAWMSFLLSYLIVFYLVTPMRIRQITHTTTPLFLGRLTAGLVRGTVIGICVVVLAPPATVEYLGIEHVWLVQIGKPISDLWGELY